MRHLSTVLVGRLGIIGAAAVVAAQLSIAAAGEIIIRNGDSIAFVGDSNTAGGWLLPSGYVRLVMQALEQEGVKATPIPAGVGGDTSERMRNRIDGVLTQKPTWLTLSCGFNDVSPACSWQVGFEDFKKHVTTILDKAQAAGVKVIILTPTLYKDYDLDNETNGKMLPYVEYLRQTAKERKLPLADLNAAHRAEMARLKSENTPRNTLLCDGIHMAPRGNMMMATGVLKTLGFTDEQIAKAKEKWLEAPYRRAIGAFWLSITVRQIENAEDFAAREKVIFRPRWTSFAGGFEEAEYFTSKKMGSEYADANPVLQLLWERAQVTAIRAAPPQADMKAIQEATQIQFGKDLDALPESGLTIKELKQLSTAAGEIMIRNGESIAFVGDSNTAAGWELPSGYVRLVMQALEQAGVKATSIPAGVAGDTSERMRNRIDGVLAKKPTWLTLSCGFNDVSPACSWQVGFEDFTKNVTAILDKAQAAGVKVIILTPTLYNDTEPDNATNRKAAPYVEFLRQTAKERGLPLADLNAAHRAEIARLNRDENAPRRFLTWGSVQFGGHGTEQMGPRGSVMMAAGVLKTLGFTDEQIAKAKEKWLDAPYRLGAGMLYRDMTVGQFEKAEAFAAKEKIESVNAVLEPLWIRALVSAAKAAPTGADMKAIREAAQIQYGKDLDNLLESGLTIKDLR